MSDPYEPNTPEPTSYDVVAAGPEPKDKRRNTPAILASIVIVMALIIGGVAFGAYRLLASHGDQPEKWAPSSSLAFVKVDLDPSVGEKVAVYRFAKHFPDVPAAKNYGDLKETVFEQAFADSPFDWQEDVKPWLGDRVGVALFPYDGSFTPIGILQHKDKAKAQAALQKAKDADGGFAFAVEDDYAIVGESQGAVDEAVKEAKQKSLADNANFSSDLDALPSDRILAVWADLPAVSKAMNKELGASAALPPGMLSPFGALGTPTLDKGRMALAVSVESNYVELQARVFGTDKNDLKNGKAGSELAALPSHTVLGAAVAHPDDLVRTFVESMEKSPAGDEIRQQLDTASSETGFDLPGDIYKALGSSLTAALQNWPAGDDVPKADLTTKPSDMAVAKKLADMVATEIPDDAPVKVTAEGGTLRVTTDGYDESGKLGDSSRFRSAMGDLDGDVAVAAYLDLHSVWQAFPADVDRNAKQLSAVGIVAGTDSTPYLRIRVAVD